MCLKQRRGIEALSGKQSVSEESTRSLRCACRGGMWAGTAALARMQPSPVALSQGAASSIIGHCFKSHLRSLGTIHSPIILYTSLSCLIMDFVFFSPLTISHLATTYFLVVLSATLLTSLLFLNNFFNCGTVDV